MSVLVFAFGNGALRCSCGARAGRRPRRGGATCHGGAHLRAGGVLPAVVHPLRPRAGFAHQFVLQRGEESQQRRQDHAGPPDRLQLPQVHGCRSQGHPVRYCCRHPGQVRRQRPLPHQHLRRLLQVSLCASAALASSSPSVFVSGLNLVSDAGGSNQILAAFHTSLAVWHYILHATTHI